MALTLLCDVSVPWVTVASEVGAALSVTPLAGAFGLPNSPYAPAAAPPAAASTTAAPPASSTRRFDRRGGAWSGSGPAGLVTPVISEDGAVLMSRSLSRCRSR